MKTNKPVTHFVDKYLLAPTNPLSVTLIGAGGTGSKVLTELGRINYSLNQLGHPGLFVKVYDDDIITSANCGRQNFARSEIGLPKAAALINRINRFYGTNWKAFQQKIATTNQINFGNIIISCVDTSKARFDLASMLSKSKKSNHRDRPIYWLDFGNSRFTGQVILATVSKIEQPKSSKFKTVSNLPFITEEYKTLLIQADDLNEPSCSLEEALNKQDLFINSSLASLGGSLLWSLFREGMTSYRGFFINLKTFSTNPIPIS
ncbi:PRTRC system ThiF family protein [Sediminibacterium sp.]|uniref:PRTRC system ThiF family protein n=1 Tax=Sediminibacterium sp. TaxID=1917865 RepID=UPI00272FABF3|nr:PRTRC system ThiF family protein [Sediminibacterium sp.]MDP2422163.1 PRTRC system ThiF family protein [Sediminibacterium sp.]